MNNLEKEQEIKIIIQKKRNNSKIKIVDEKKNNKYVVLDLFCGCGGMTQGLLNAGFEILAGIDIWDKAIENYKKNYKHIAICEDLKKLLPNEFNKKYNKDNKKIDIIVGGPPCFIAGTKVLTNSGYKSIEDVLITDLLMTHTGKFQNIVNLQKKTYNNELYELKIKYHPETIVCTEEHPFYIREKKTVWNNSTRKYDIIFDNPKWKNANELTMNDYFGMVINTTNIIPEFTFEKEIDQHLSKDTYIKLDKKEYWYMMGYFIANGWVEETEKKENSQSYNIKFSINDEDENQNENEVLKIINQVLPITEQKCDYGKCKKFECSNYIWFQILKMFDKYADGKVIPEFVQNAPKIFIQEFINGYIKACGNIEEDGKLCLTIVSDNLAYAIQRLYLKLGYIFSIDKISTTNTTIIEGRIINQKETYNVDGVVEDYSFSSFIENNYVWYVPENIGKKKIEPTLVYNFEVSNDNSYIVENIIVHNCQGFSIAGKRDTNDPRNSLFMEYVKYLDFFQPKAFIMENVIGILSMKTEKNEKVIDIIKQQLEKNYNIIITKLYASDFEVPQNRRRTIIIGINKSLKKNLTCPTPILSESERIPVKTILLKKENIEKKYFLTEKAITGINNKKQKSLEKGAGFGAQFLDLNKPSYTISARYWKDGYDALVKYSDTEIRKLTILELKRIQTFPDDYILEGTKKDIIMQIGNAVACKFAYHLGKHLINILS